MQFWLQWIFFALMFFAIEVFPWPLEIALADPVYHDLPCTAYGQSSINLAVYRRNALLTIGDDRVLAYMDRRGDICITTRKVTGRTFSTKTIANPMDIRYLGDGHQGVFMGYSADGYLHLIWGAHGTKSFFYQRLSWPDLRSTGGDTRELNLVSDLITYPQFYEVSGQLVLFYRDDVNRTWNINRYDAVQGKWSSETTVVLTTPEYFNSLYPNHLATRGDTIVIPYVWRYPDVVNPKNPLIINEGLRVVVSRDRGATWSGIDGKKRSLPIAATTPEIVLNLPAGRNLSNQGGAWLSRDEKTLWIAYLLNDAKEMTQIFVSRIDLQSRKIDTSQVSRNPQAFEMIGRGTLSLPLSRPAVFEIEDRLVVLYRQDDSIQAAWTTPTPSSTMRWQTVELHRGYLENWEPILDYTALSQGILSLFVQGAKQGIDDLNYPDPVNVGATLLEVSGAELDRLFPRGPAALPTPVPFNPRGKKTPDRG